MHILLIFSINQNILSKNTRILKKNKEKNITRVKFIDLPDKLKEIKHNDKAKYIAQKSYKAEKETKKNNPLIKNKGLLKPEKKLKPKPKKKIAIVKEAVPLIPSNKTMKQSEKKRRSRKNIKKQKVVKKKNVKKDILKKKFISKKSKSSLKPKTTPKHNTIVSLNKVSPTFEELLEKGLIPKKVLQRKPTPKQNKVSKGSKRLSKTFKDNNVQKLSPNIFKSSHIYPDDIDISDSVSISTQSSRFASYLHKVKRKIELVWEYPRIAGEMGISGRLFIKFTINRTGMLEKVELLKSSGASILDHEAIRAIKDAAPYPPFPKDNSFGVNKIKIHACFEYVLTGKELW